MTDLRLVPDKVVVPALAGFGAQYNQNVYAAISRNAGVTEANVGEMERKVLSLKPHLVRIFFDHHAFADPDRMESFVRTVELAERSAASINITWQGGGTASPEGSMSQFADLLVDLADKHGIGKLRWVTVLNEPNSKSGGVTMEVYERLYRLLDANLTAAGVRGQIRFMGGDLLGTESGLGQTQDEWFRFLASRMSDLLEVHSIHVYWDYWDTAKLERSFARFERSPTACPQAAGSRVRGARSRASGRTSGEVRGRNSAPGHEHQCFPACLVRPAGGEARLLRNGQVGRVLRPVRPQATRLSYDRRSPGRMAASPRLRVTRLLTRTVRAGWKVVGIDGAAGTKLVTGFAGSQGRLTLIGLDRAGGSLNGVSPTQGWYRLAGLPPKTSFQLLYWNQAGDGRNSGAGSLVSDVRGVLTVSAPLHSVFALTTVANR